MASVKELKKDLRSYVNEEKAAFFPRFFRTGKGEYGEGDIFIGVTVPNQKKVAKKYRDLDLKSVATILTSKIHEERLTALFILIHHFDAALKNKDEKRVRLIENFYRKHIQWVNNWDLVDASAHKILGRYLVDKKDRKILYTYATSKNLWKRRVAIVSTWWFIREGQLDDTFKLSEVLINDQHDLIHKAVGWMLREAGKRDEKKLKAFLKKHYKKMPRTMLRYSIEKFPEKQRKEYLHGKV